MPNDDDLLSDTRLRAFAIYDDIELLLSQGFSIFVGYPPVNPYLYSNDVSALRSAIEYNRKLILVRREDGGIVIKVSPGGKEIVVSRPHSSSIMLPRDVISGKTNVYEVIRACLPEGWIVQKEE